jgi:signal peptidase I
MIEERLDYAGGQKNNPFAPIIDFVVNISTAVVIFLVIYFFIAQPHQVEGSSMVPNFHSGDYVLTEKITQHLSGIHHGDVIVFHYPKNPGYDYIKRVIGLPNDTVVLRGGLVYVNDSPLEETYLANNIVKINGQENVMGSMTPGQSFLREGEPYKVAEHELIVMGDNRLESSDSRDWGAVPDSLVVGKVFFRYWPPSRIGFVDN